MVDHDSLYTDDETERKKKKKTRVLGEEVGLAPGLRTSYILENADRGKKIIAAVQPDGFYTPKDNPVGDAKVVRMIHLFVIFILYLFSLLIPLLFQHVGHVRS